ncbi:hypothetical protein CCACVL1_09769 [Corchorus capsularis]|uniref:Uncharacterized protein n=1 Tax=Corchorus capsularis TaxID=210143 RepID=A0A1R3IUB3_COCAP|nr:hypothetical protein CCACVL1_09769 [Corchorus capsularis]
MVGFIESVNGGIDRFIYFRFNQNGFMKFNSRISRLP